jgi:pimeloyl-ACP methyl ester carboxylesterase
MPVLDRVEAPTLLLVGGDDSEVLELNEEALEQLRATRGMRVIPGATHLFEEPGALEQVASLAAEWFVRHLGERRPEARP